MPPSSAPDDLQEVAFYPSNAPDAFPYVEFLWCAPVGEGIFRILTIPFHVDGIAVGDVIETADDPELAFVRLREPSGHSTLRVHLELGLEPGAFFAQLEALACTHRATEQKQFFVLDIPETCSITDVLDYLSEGQDRDHCDWDVGSISPIHGAALRAVLDADDLPDWVPRP
jgi:hypothetical protein